MLETGTKQLSAKYPARLSSFQDIFEKTEDVVFPDQSAEERKKRVLDALGSFAWGSRLETTAYRWRGEDTLTWGNIDRWLLVEWVRNILESPQDEELRRQCQYEVLSKIVKHARLSELDSLYHYRGKEQVREYLVAHPPLIDFLQDSYPHLLRCFGPDVTYVLEVVEDPEGDHRNLFVYICTSLEIEQALSGLDKFDDEWFLNQIGRLNGSVNFNLEIR